MAIKIYKSPRSPSLVIRAKELSELLGVAPSTLYRWRKEHKLPKAIQLGKGFTAWRRSDIDQWLDDQTKPETEDKPETPEETPKPKGKAKGLISLIRKKKN